MEEDIFPPDVKTDVEAVPCPKSRTPEKSEEEFRRMAYIRSVVESLKNASNDTQKFTYLLVLAKVVNQNGGVLTSELRLEIFEAVGFHFLIRLLKTKEATGGCPARVYQCIAVTILRCLCVDPALAVHPGALEAVPHVVDVVLEGAYAERDTDLTLIQDAYDCLILFSSYEAGCMALLKCGAPEKLSSIIVEERFNHEQSLKALLTMVQVVGSATWAEDVAVFLSIIERLALDFEKDRSKDIVRTCGYITRMLYSAPKNLLPLKAFPWIASLQRGVADLLGSRINKELREAGLHLAAAVVESVDPCCWLKVSHEEANASSFLPRNRFVVLLVRLAVVELRVILEDSRNESVYESKDVLGSCYCILENVLTAYTTGKLQHMGEEDRTQVYQDVDEGAWVVLGFLKTFLPGKLDSDSFTEPDEEIVTASVRILSVRLVDDPDAFHDDLYEILPLLCRLLLRKEQSDLWDILLPAFVPLSVEERSRKIIMEFGIPKALLPKFDVLRKEILQTCQPEKRLVKQMEQNKAKLILSLLLNILVSEREAVRKDGLEERTSNGYLKFWRPIFETVLDLSPPYFYIPLVGHLIVCGLMLARIFPELQDAICRFGFRFLTATIRFVWDAFNVEESADGETLDVSFSYKPFWDEVKDIWYIAMDCVTKLVEKNRSMTDFIVLVEWPVEVVRCLAGSNPILPHTSVAFESFLLAIARASPAAEKAMKDFGPHKFCDTHGMTTLKNFLVPSTPGETP